MVELKHIANRNQLLTHATALFALQDVLKSLEYGYGGVATRYLRGNQTELEMLWCMDDTPTAGLELLWHTGMDSYWALALPSGATKPRLYSVAPSGRQAPQPPAETLQRAFNLLVEIGDERELLHLYRTGGRFESEDLFIFGEYMPLPDGAEVNPGAGSGAQYTISRSGALGIHRPYSNDKSLCAYYNTTN